MGYTGGLSPNGVPSSSSQYIKGKGKISSLAYLRFTKSAAKWKKWWRSEIYQRVPHFDRNDYATESERLKTREKRGDTRKFY